MGQKTNPNILRLGITKNYDHRYLEKKSSELAKYDFNNIEIQKFVYKFFRDNRLNVHNCKIGYSQDGIVKIFISYYAEFDLNFLTESKPLDSHNSDRDNNQFEKNDLYEIISYIKKFKSIHRPQLKLLRRELKKNYAYSLNYNKKITLKKYNNIKHLKLSSFLNLLCESLSKILNKKLKFFLTLQQLNSKLTKINNKNDIKIIKKSLVKLNRYQQKKNTFFKEGINTVFICCQNQNSAGLLAEFIAIQLKTLKSHNFFFKFIKHCLTLFKKSGYSKLTGVKIKIKGRINRRPRAKHQFYTVGKKIPVLSINSKINYAEKIAFTPNGTLGIKVWTI